MKISLPNDMSHDYILKTNKRALRALGRSPEEKIKGHSGAMHLQMTTNVVHQISRLQLIFMPPPLEEWWRSIKCYPCPCMRAFVRVCVRPSIIKIWCVLNYF